MNENEVNVQKNSNNKGLVILIIFLVVAVLGLSGYIVYDKCIAKNNSTNNGSTSVDNQTNQETKNIQNVITTVTDSALIEKLEEELYVKDTREDYESVNGVYYGQKLTSNDTNNKYLIGFNIRKYLKENNIPVTSCIDQSSNGTCLLAKLSKEEISNYINKKYNTNLNYSYVSSNSDDKLDYNYTSIMAYDNGYNIELIGHSGAGVDLKTKLVKAEEDNNNIYIYNKSVTCVRDMGISCDSSIYKAYTSESLYSCDVNSSEDRCKKMDSAIDYVFNSMNDKLKTYKHTFKKLNGNYYWVSTEVVE